VRVFSAFPRNKKNRSTKKAINGEHKVQTGAEIICQIKGQKKSLEMSYLFSPESGNFNVVQKCQNVVQKFVKILSN